MHIFFYVLLLIGFDHALYVSVVQVELSDSKTEASVIVKVFSDDLLSALKNVDSTVIMNLDFIDNYEENIDAYFRDQIKLDDLAPNLELSKIVEENDSHWIYFTLKWPEESKSVNLTANHFMELFPTQSNIVTFKHHGSMQSFRLTKSKPTCTISLK